MKNNNKNGSGLCKKNMNLTAQVADVLKSLNRKPLWKNKTNNLTKTLASKTTGPIENPMTQDDINKLFKNYSKSKQKDLIPTKVSTEVAEVWANNENKNFLNAVKFLKIEDEWDRLLTGVQPDDFQEAHIDNLFNNFDSTVDLTTQFKKDFLVGKIIGEGAYASVRVAVYKPLNKKIAIKVYEKNKIKEIQRKKSVRREIKILQLLNHKNIVKIYDVVETNNHLNIVMEYLPGTSLGSFLKAQQNCKISESNCKKIFWQLAKALRYMHSLNIAHRDIKLENIILDEQINPKLIDFGFSTCIEPSKKVKIFCGTPSYMAPQVVQRKQYRGENADIWALGVLLFVSLTGIFPFKGSSDQQLYKKINNSEYPKAELLFSRSASDLISRMLTINPNDRITANEIINHLWFCEGRDSSKKKNTEISFENRKRVNTISSNHSKQNKWGNKTGKKILMETCKDNLHLQIKMSLKSPTGKKEIASYRKNDKENTLRALKSDKNTHREVKDIKKEKLGKTHSKVIDLLRMEMKRKQIEKSKSKPKTKGL